MGPWGNRALLGIGKLLLALVGTTCAAHAAEQQPVYWAGVAFTGAHADRASVAPQISAAIEARGLASLNRALSESLQRTPPDNLQLIQDDLARLDGSTSATVMAAAFDREVVSIEPIGGKYKLLVEVALQALFFDFRERQVIASYPLTLQRIDITPERPSQAQIQALVDKLLYGNDANDLSQTFARTLLAVRLPSAASRRLQVVSVALSDNALVKLPDPKAADVVRSTLAHEFSKLLGAGTGIALLPPSSGEAVGGVMAARFADGTVYQLRIPEPDYAIHLRVDSLRNGVISETPAMRTALFGAFFNVLVEEPHSRKVYFDQPLRKGATKLIPASQGAVDTWSASYETLLAGLEAFAGVAAGSTGSREWLAEQKPGGRPLQQQVKSLQELIKSCR